MLRSADNPLHARLAGEGYSWIDYQGGPRDGARAYFKGPPLFALVFVDPPSTEPGPGDPEYAYELAAGPDGYAVYRYCGPERSPACVGEPPF